MAALPIIANTFRVALQWAIGTQEAVNVMHFRAASAGKTAAQVYTCINAHATANMWLGVSSSAIVTTLAITPLDGAGATITTSTGSPAKWTGGTAGDFVPAASILVKLNTVLRGPAYRGRLYLPAPQESVIANGLLGSVTAGSMQTAWDNFRAALVIDGTTPGALVVASYKRDVANDVIASTVELPLATQRRRQTRLR